MKLSNADLTGKIYTYFEHKMKNYWLKMFNFNVILESYPLSGYILGSGAPVTNTDGPSGAINGMKCWSVTPNER